MNYPDSFRGGPSRRYSERADESYNIVPSPPYSERAEYDGMRDHPGPSSAVPRMQNIARETEDDDDYGNSGRRPHPDDEPIVLHFEPGSSMRPSARRPPLDDNEPVIIHNGPGSSSGQVLQHDPDLL